MVTSFLTPFLGSGTPAPDCVVAQGGRNRLLRLVPKVSAALWERSSRRDSFSIPVHDDLDRDPHAHPPATETEFRRTDTFPKRFANFGNESQPNESQTRVKNRFPEDSQPPRGRHRRSGVSFLPRNEIWRSSRRRNARLNRFCSRGLDHPPGACSRYFISSGERGPVPKDRRATVPPWKARERPRSRLREHPRRGCRRPRGCHCPHCRYAGRR